MFKFVPSVFFLASIFALNLAPAFADEKVAVAAEEVVEEEKVEEEKKAD